MSTDDGLRPAQRHGDASEPLGAHPWVGQTGTEALRAICVTPNPIFDELRRPRIVGYPLAPIDAAIWAIVSTHMARLWGDLPDDVTPCWWSAWAGDPYTDIRTELAGYMPDDAEVTLAGIRALAGAR